MSTPSSEGVTTDPFALRRDERWRLVVLIALALAQAALTLPSLLVVRRLLDVDENSRPEAIALGGLLAALVVAGVVLQRAARIQGLGIAEGVIGRVRVALATRLAAIGRDELAGRDVDEVHADVVFAAERVERATAGAIAGLLPSAIVVVVVGLVITVLSPPLALALVVCSLPAVGLARMQRGRLVAALRRFHRALGQYSGVVFDALRLRDLISAHGAERQIEAKLAASGLEAGAAQRLAQSEQATYSAWQYGIIGAAGGIALGVGAAFVGEHQARNLVTLIAAFGLIQGSLRTVVGSLPQALEGRAARSVLESFLAGGGTPPPPSTVVLAGDRWDLEGVRFAYPGGDHEVLSGVDLHLERGRIVGIEGPNGSGKTTLVALLMGWYPPDGGRIDIDGLDATSLDPAAVRARIGLVPQEPEFMDASVRENLALGLEPPPSDEAFAAVLALSTADRTLAGRREGLDERMGRDGRRFSGGHRQRLAIARALLRNPSLLIIDEPTNHLDPLAATTLLENLAASHHNWAMLVVSHDPAVLAICDSVFRLEHGVLHALPQSSRAEA